MRKAPTLSFARVLYANITRCAQCTEKSLLAQNTSILVLFIAKNAILCVRSPIFQNTDSPYIAEFCALNEYPEFHKNNNYFNKILKN